MNDTLAIHELTKNIHVFSEFETTLEEALQSDTSGYFGRLMVALCANGREPSEGWDMSEAEESAQKLYEVNKALRIRH